MISVVKFKQFLYIPLFLLIVPLFNSCSKNNLDLYGFTMGTSYSIKINHNKFFKDSKLKNKIEKELNYISSVFSTYDEKSELSLINNSKKNSFTISDDMMIVLEKSLYFSEISDGMYDPTVFPLVDLWGFGPSLKSDKPKNDSIIKVLNYVSYKNIEISNNKINLKNKNTIIDLSSIAKGYAVDKVADLLLNEGYDNFMVEIGGEVKCIGKNHGAEWVIGITNPLDDFSLIKTNLSNLSMATSGSYNNYTYYDGIKYSHIINPKTGFPLENNIISATVIAQDCIDADAIATLLMLFPYKKGLDLINTIDNVECYLIIEDEEKKVVKQSTGFYKYLF
ncbi:MAG: hypothetical protein CMG01_02500 [Candidatus Marinimicrobia bacterium]|nr:hypothetical protein [Candidatus Neomarinimicrobiota bacterium]|tara:strand:+ start:30491 stop:31498 length:1008 start_codon:yes stop_codon:yes gene_type:complete